MPASALSQQRANSITILDWTLVWLGVTIRKRVSEKAHSTRLTKLLHSAVSEGNLFAESRLLTFLAQDPWMLTKGFSTLMDTTNRGI